MFKCLTFSSAKKHGVFQARPVLMAGTGAKGTQSVLYSASDAGATHTVGSIPPQALFFFCAYDIVGEL